MSYSVTVNINENLPLIKIFSSSTVSEMCFRRLANHCKRIGYITNYGANLTRGGFDKCIIQILYSEISINCDTKKLNTYEVAKSVELLLNDLNFTIVAWERGMNYRTLKSNVLEAVYPELLI